jgi:hypothetical protein
MTVKVTQPVYGTAVGQNYTGTAEEEAWLMEQGYATSTTPNPAYNGIDNTSVVATSDPTNPVNREYPGDAYQFGLDAALGARVRYVDPDNWDLTNRQLPAAGGTVVFVYGDNFTGATGVTFGGTAGTAFTVVDARTIRVTTPAKAAGSYDVVVTKGAGNGTLTSGVTYV